ncbi:MAG: winged helix-turn-helix domain-containing protein [Erythrobacter sp.]
MNVPALSERLIAIGEATYDSSTRILMLGDQEQRLEPRIAQLLEAFCEKPVELLEREELLDRVWGEEGSDEALTQAVSRLRHLLGDRALIQTEPRKGYRLAVEPCPADAFTEQAATRESPEVAPPAHASIYSSRTVQLAFVSGLVVGTMAAAIAALLMWPSPVTVTHEITQRPGEEPVSNFVRCDGTVEECADVLD